MDTGEMTEEKKRRYIEDAKKAPLISEWLCPYCYAQGYEGKCGRCGTPMMKVSRDCEKAGDASF